MKKYYLIIIIASFIVNISFSQNIDKETAFLDSLIFNTPVNKNLKNYYKNVYSAENCILKTEYEKAAILYEKAFSYHEFPFSIDLDNAIVCEIKSRKNENNIKKYITLQMNKDAKKVNYLNDSSLFLLSNWKEIENIINTTEAKIDTVLLNFIWKLYDADQDFRRNNHGDYSQESLKEMDILDIINYNELIKIIQLNSDISEEKIGLSGWGKLSIIPWHSPEMLEIYKYLFQSVVAGKLDARKFYDLFGHSDYRINGKYNLGVLTYSVGSSYCSSIANMENFDLPDYFITKEYKNVKVLDNCRKKLYIESFNDYQKKCIWDFMQDNKTNKFRFDNETTTELNYNDTFFKTLKTKKNSVGDKVKIYYRNKEEEKQLQEAMKEYYKNNSVKP